jgi:hypothetical protein
MSEYNALRLMFFIILELLKEYILRKYLIFNIMKTVKLTSFSFYLTVQKIYTIALVSAKAFWQFFLCFQCKILKIMPISLYRNQRNTLHS